MLKNILCVFPRKRCAGLYTNCCAATLSIHLPSSHLTDSRQHGPSPHTTQDVSSVSLTYHLFPWEEHHSVLEYCYYYFYYLYKKKLNHLDSPLPLTSSVLYVLYVCECVCNPVIQSMKSRVCRLKGKLRGLWSFPANKIEISPAAPQGRSVPMTQPCGTPATDCQWQRHTASVSVAVKIPIKSKNTKKNTLSSIWI